MSELHHSLWFILCRSICTDCARIASCVKVSQWRRYGNNMHRFTLFFSFFLFSSFFCFPLKSFCTNCRADIHEWCADHFASGITIVRVHVYVCLLYCPFFCTNQEHDFSLPKNKMYQQWIVFVIFCWFTRLEKCMANEVKQKSDNVSIFLFCCITFPKKKKKEKRDLNEQFPNYFR